MEVEGWWWWQFAFLSGLLCRHRHILPINGSVSQGSLLAKLVITFCYNEVVTLWAGGSILSSHSLMVFQRRAKQGIHCCTKTLSTFQPKTMYPDSFPCDESLPSRFLVPHMLRLMESQPHILDKTCLNSTVISTSIHVVWWAVTL